MTEHRNRRLRARDGEETDSWRPAHHLGPGTALQGSGAVGTRTGAGRWGEAVTQSDFGQRVRSSLRL